MSKHYKLSIAVGYAILAASSFSPATVSAQFATGACCHEDNEAAPKSSIILYTCTETTEAQCPLEPGGGVYLGDGSTCGAEGPYVSRDDCQADATLLPVELTSFGAIVNGVDVLLEWVTASESNNAGFSVERETGEEVFTEIAFVKGQGTTTEQQEYHHIVYDLDPGLHRFRLRQIDFDGAFEYSQVVEAAVTLPDRFLIEPAYPNPFNPSTTLRFAVPVEQHVEVTLVNAAGKSIRTLHSGSVAANEMQQLTVAADGLPSGTYLVHFNGNGLSATERIVLAK